MTDQRSKILNYLNISLKYSYYFLFIITPLIMASVTSELFEFNKMIIIYLITIVIVFLWLSKFILLNKIIIKKTPFDIPIILFLVSQLLSTYFSIDRHTSIFGYYGRFNGGLLSIITYITLYYGFVSNYHDFDKNYLIRLLKISLVTSFLVILWGLPGRFGHDLSCLLFTGQFTNSCWTNQFRPAERMFSTLGQPNWLGAYLVINFFIGLYFFSKTSETKYLILNTGYLIVNFCAILFTRSRSSLIALIIGIIIYSLYYFYNKRRLVILGLILLLPVLIFKTGITKIDRLISLSSYINLNTNRKVIAKNTGNTVAQSSNFTDVTESGDIRKIVWKGAVLLGEKYPFLGSGVETFAYSYYFVRPREHNLTSEWDYLYNKAHNEFLNYLATTGFVGLGCYLILIASVIFIAFKKLKIQNSKFKITSQNSKFEKPPINNNQLLIICLFLSYLSILITNFFGFSTTTINLFFYLMPAMIMIVGNSDYQDKPAFAKASAGKQKIYFFFLLVFSLYLLVSVFLYWIADVTYAKADNLYKLGSYQEAANYFNTALKLKYEHVYEDKASYILANLAFVAFYQKQKDISNQLVNLAEYYNKKSIQASPKNVLYRKTTAKNDYLFFQIDQNQKNLKQGIGALDEAAVLAPTDPKIPYSQALFYSLLADETKKSDDKARFSNLSIKAINRSIYLKSNDAGYYLLKGQLLKKFGDREGAQQQFQYILDKFDKNNEDAKKELNSL